MLDAATLAFHVWAYAVFASGLAWLWSAGLAATLHRRAEARGPWAWIGLYALFAGLTAWLRPLAASPGQCTLVALVQLLLLACGAGLARVLWKHLRSLPWGVARAPFGLVMAGILAGACLGAAVVPDGSLLPDGWPNRLAFFQAVGCHVELVEALCALAVLAAAEWCRQTRLAPNPTRARRWGPLTALLVVAALGWPLTGTLQSRAVAAEAAAGAAGSSSQATAGVAEAGSETWGRLASERLWAGLPLLVMLVLLTAGLASAHIVQSRAAKRTLAARRTVRSTSR